MAKILVVDDEKHIVRLVQVNLERAGYETVTAFSGNEGLEKMRIEKPDLVVLDIMMPGKDGWEVLKDMALDTNLSEIPVLVLSAKAQDADIAKTLRTGMAIHLTKPFNPKELLVFVERILQSVSEGEYGNDDEPVWEV